LKDENKNYPLIIDKDKENFKRNGDIITGTGVGSSVLSVRHRDYGQHVHAALRINTVLPGGSEWPTAYLKVPDDQDKNDTEQGPFKPDSSTINVFRDADKTDPIKGRDAWPWVIEPETCPSAGNQSFTASGGWPGYSVTQEFQCCERPYFVDKDGKRIEKALVLLRNQTYKLRARGGCGTLQFTPKGPIALKGTTITALTIGTASIEVSDPTFNRWSSILSIRIREPTHIFSNGDIL
jgi:hypothetical protein